MNLSLDLHRLRVHRWRHLFTSVRSGGGPGWLNRRGRVHRSGDLHDRSVRCSGRRGLGFRRAIGNLAGALSLSCALLGGATSVHAESATITPQQLLSQIQDQTAPTILDVRSAAEFATGHVPGAINMPVRELSSRLDELFPALNERTVVVYCERGGRAARAEALLRRNGASRVLHLEGDMSGWRRAQHPLEHPEAVEPPVPEAGAPN